MELKYPPYIILTRSNSSRKPILIEIKVKTLEDLRALDSVSRYESAKKCHQCMIEVFGHPQKEEALSVDDIQQQKFLGRGIYEIVVVIHTDYPIQRLDTWFFAKNPILMLMATDKIIYT